MTWTHWLLLFLGIQLIHGAATYPLYKKAGHEPWKAFVPLFNAWILLKIIHRPSYWIVFLLLPVVNLIMLPVIWVETIRAFSLTSRKDAWTVVLSLGFYLFGSAKREIASPTNLIERKCPKQVLANG